jgi:DNA-binding transcriptional MerR regulator
MTSIPQPVEIPNKSAFKPSEVCDVLGVPAYVLRTWETEFSDLGVAKASGGARVYRRRDVELAVRIRDLVFTEHLTLAGVRRRLEQEGLITPPAVGDVGQTSAAAVLSEPDRARIAHVKEELRALLQQLAHDAMQSASSEAQTGTGADGRARPARHVSKPREKDSPVLPGFDAPAGAPLSDDQAKSGRYEGRLDPAALNFASVSAPLAPPSGRRRRDKSDRD